uniref:Ig-like domain-containing protein n=1 Tax=Salarias fasciatus TaxID=181472 RepID=A0A672G2P4_SALFA
MPPSLLLLPGPDVLEGGHVTLSCQSDGAPPPTLVLRREGAELQRAGPAPSSSSSVLTFNLSSAALEDSAHYSCEAANQHGSKMAAVTLRVKAPPRNTRVLVLPSAVVPLGHNVTVWCRSAGWPPPALTLTRLADGARLPRPPGGDVDGGFLLVDVRPEDGGRYRVNASNELGSEVTHFRITVTGNANANAND